MQTALTSAGFNILVPFSGTPDSNGNLLEVSYTAPTNQIQPVPINIAQNSPFSYLNNGFFANFSATAQYTVPYTVTSRRGHSQRTNPAHVLRVGQPQRPYGSLTSSIAANTINADLGIGDLASVTATNSNAQQVLSVTGSLGFQSLPSNPLDAGGKLRASDFTNSLGKVIQGERQRVGTTQRQLR